MCKIIKNKSLGFISGPWYLRENGDYLFACICSGALGMLFGAIAIRRRGIYFSMITLALAQMLFFIYLKAPFTGGEDGMQSIPRGKLFGMIDLSNDMVLYWTMIGISIVAFYIIWRTSRSPFGQTFRAIGNHEPRARSLGIPTAHLKHMAFVISAVLTGLAGSMKAIIFQVAALNDAYWTFSGEGVLMCLLGVWARYLGRLLVLGLLLLFKMVWQNMRVQ